MKYFPSAWFLTTGIIRAVLLRRVRRQHGGEITRSTAGFDLDDLRYFREALNDFDVGFARNKKVKPDAIMSGILLEIETGCRNRTVLQDLIDRGKRLVQIGYDERITVGSASLNLVFDERKKVKCDETHCRSKYGDQIHS